MSGPSTRFAFVAAGLGLLALERAQRVGRVVVAQRGHHRHLRLPQRRTQRGHAWLLSGPSGLGQFDLAAHGSLGGITQGGEDYDLGIRLERAGWAFFLNQNLFTSESEEDHYLDEPLPRIRKIVTPDRLPAGFETGLEAQFRYQPPDSINSMNR